MNRSERTSKKNLAILLKFVNGWCMAAKNVVVKGISLDPDVLTKGLERASQLGFQNSFSAYVQQLIRADIKSEEASDFKSSTAVVQSAAGGAERVVDLNKHSSPSISEKKKKKRA